MAVLSFNPAVVSVSISKPPSADGPPPGDVAASAAWPGVELTKTVSVVCSGSSDPGVPIDLAVLGSAPWVSAPLTCLHGVAFAVVIDGEDLQPYAAASDILRASTPGYTSADLPIEAMPYPDAYPAPRARGAG
jgi:hypothetical protein